VLYDPLSFPGEWSDGSDTSFGGACNFTGDAYHISETGAHKNYICGGLTTYSDFAVQVQMIILKGDCGGIDFRSDGTGAKTYDFRVCSDGSYGLYLYTSNTKSRALRTGSSNQIKQGIKQTNTIAVVAQGTSISLYVNNGKIDSVNDSSYSSGEIGFIAVDDRDVTEVAYSNAKVWTF
jgi:hypothetical protein